MFRSVFWIFLSYCLGRSIAFSCVCTPAECETVTDDECPDRAGTVWDPCGCCKVCARAENQPCGGPYGFFGSCAHDLECVVTDVTNDNSGGICTRKFIFIFFPSFPLIWFLEGFDSTKVISIMFQFRVMCSPWTDVLYQLVITDNTVKIKFKSASHFCQHAVQIKQLRKFSLLNYETKLRDFLISVKTMQKLFLLSRCHWVCVWVCSWVCVWIDYFPQ